jgi:hypothetical protein
MPHNLQDHSDNFEFTNRNNGMGGCLGIFLWFTLGEIIAGLLQVYVFRGNRLSSCLNILPGLIILLVYMNKSKKKLVEKDKSGETSVNDDNNPG